MVRRPSGHGARGFPRRRDGRVSRGKSEPDYTAILRGLHAPPAAPLPCPVSPVSPASCLLPCSRLRAACPSCTSCICRSSDTTIRRGRKPGCTNQSQISPHSSLPFVPETRLFGLPPRTAASRHRSTAPPRSIDRASRVRPTFVWAPERRVGARASESRSAAQTSIFAEVHALPHGCEASKSTAAAFFAWGRGGGAAHGEAG